MSLTYSISARLYPVAIVVLPIGLAALAWFPDEAAALGLLAATGTTTIFAALAMLFTQLGRDAGKSKEQGLWQSWGGKPTTQLLRHRDKHLDVNTKRRYHSRLSELVEVTLPTEEQEAQDPGSADEAYDSCVRWLIAQTRNSKEFSVLLKENTNYGFRRNLWGMRPTGILLSAAGAIASCMPIALNWTQGTRFTAVFATVVSVALFVLWIRRFTTEWIRIPSYRYAEELFLAVDVLKPEDS